MDAKLVINDNFEKHLTKNVIVITTHTFFYPAANLKKCIHRNLDCSAFAKLLLKDMKAVLPKLVAVNSIIINVPFFSQGLQLLIDEVE